MSLFDVVDTIVCRVLSMENELPLQEQPINLWQRNPWGDPGTRMSRKEFLRRRDLLVGIIRQKARHRQRFARGMFRARQYAELADELAQCQNRRQAEKFKAALNRRYAKLIDRSKNPLGAQFCGIYIPISKVIGALNCFFNRHGGDPSWLKEYWL